MCFKVQEVVVSDVREEEEDVDGFVRLSIGSCIFYFCGLELIPNFLFLLSSESHIPLYPWLPLYSFIY